ncbi:hypothetical protein [Halorubellus sp. PRR65]|uniref:hypothetical protein n=1 Tax=Halorubellus sp. PRR65 TaxID=3098148 RepID=UPI002B257D9B|nr:hypothetical protein [Halorubellus sp. PRR65]
MELGLAIVLLVFGLPGAVWPYKMARLEERFDSIGSKRSWSEVETADWKVILTRVVGVLMALVGVGGLFAG